MQTSVYLFWAQHGNKNIVLMIVKKLSIFSRTCGWQEALQDVFAVFPPGLNILVSKISELARVPEKYGYTIFNRLK